MAEFDFESTLAVDVQGEEAVNRLNAALAALQGQATSAQRVVSAAGNAAAARAATAEVAQVTQQASAQAGTLGERLGAAFSQGVTGAIRAPFDALRATATVAGRSLRNFAGPLGQIAGSAGVGATAVIGLTAVIAGLAAPVLSLIAGFRLLRSSFGWAQEAAEEQLRVAARTRRFYPQLMGEGLAAAEDEMRTRMGVATALFGAGAEQMQEAVTRRFTQYRLGRGVRGEQDIFSRWGITPQGIERFEQMTGSRIDLAGWLRLWVIQREQLQQRLATAQTPEERAALTRRLGMLADDATKLFGQQFSDMMLAMNDTDLVRLRGNLQRATALGRPRDAEQATRNAVNFRIAFEGLQETFRNLRAGIGNDVRPAITNFLTALNEKILAADENGRSLGQSLRELASSLANRAWETLLDIMNRIDVTRVNSWIEAINSWSPKDTADKIETIFTAVWSFGSSILAVIEAVQRFFAIIPDWLKTPTPQIPTAFEEAEQRGTWSPIPGLSVSAPGFGGGAAPAAPAPVTAAGSQPAEAGQWSRRIGEAIGGAASSVGGWFNRNLGISSARAGELTPEQRATFGAGAQPATAPTTAPAASTLTVVAPQTPLEAAAAYTPPTPAPAAAPLPPTPPLVTPEAQPEPIAAADATERRTIRDRINDIWQQLPTFQSLRQRLGLQPSETAAPTAPVEPPAPLVAAPGPPPAVAEPPVAAPPVQAAKPPETEEGFFNRLRDIGDSIMDRHRQASNERLLDVARQIEVPHLPPVVAPHQPLEDTSPSQTALDALKGAALGRAMAITADVQTGSGAEIVMRANTFGGHEAASAAASYDPYADPSQTRNRVRNVIGPWLNRNFGVTLPGSELATAAAQGTTEPAAWETQAATLTAPEITSAWTGGLTTEDGAAFGTAAGQAVRQQLEGLNVGWQGQQSWETAAQSIPWTGPNTPTDS